MSSSNDIIQISFGSTANAITAHSLNLQGLAATDPDDGCHIQTTHRLERNYWVPRCLLVDEPTNFFITSQVSNQVSQLLQQEQQQQQQQQSFMIQPLDTALSLQHIQPNPWSEQYQALSSTLAYSTHSRYYQEPVAVGSKYRTSQENSRHVNWDDEEEENEEEEQQDNYYNNYNNNEEDSWQTRPTRKQQEYSKWQRDTLEPLQSQLFQAVESSPFSLLQSTEKKTSSTTATTTSTSSTLSWMDYWMPPYSNQSKVALEYSHQSHLIPHWDSYHRHLNSNNDWMENVLLDRLRLLLEESDSCQGFIVTTQGNGIYAGLTTAMLQEIQQEVKSASRLVFQVTNPEIIQNDITIQTENDAESQQAWQPAHVQRVRNHISSGLAMYDMTQNAHIVVPLVRSEQSPLFQSAAQLALAMEACTLPIRFNTTTNTRRIGLTNVPFLGQGGDYDMNWGSTAHSLSMSEYIQCLQPSHQYKVLELDTLSTNIDNDELWQALLSGTSLEHDIRTRRTGTSYHRPQDIPPGRWLQPISGDGNGDDGGLLTRLSPNPSASFNPRFHDRTLHHHFSISTSIRPGVLDPISSDPRYQYDPSSKTTSHYLTTIIQGMGIIYRPERSVATIGSQSIGHLTLGKSNGITGSGAGAGAGIYWKSLLSNDIMTQPTMSVLSNSTRIYSHLEQISSNMKQVLGSRFRGYHQRDIMNGILPEEEDCYEALEGCYDLRDLYHPPDGSGLVVPTNNGDIDF